MNSFSTFESLIKMQKFSQLKESFNGSKKNFNYERERREDCLMNLVWVLKRFWVALLIICIWSFLYKLIYYLRCPKRCNTALIFTGHDTHWNVRLEYLSLWHCRLPFVTLILGRGKTFCKFIQALELRKWSSKFENMEIY